MSADARGWRVALLPDALVNPPGALDNPPHPPLMPGLDVLSVIEANGYGVLQLPPPGRHGLLLAVIADQVAEYAHHGYAVIAVGIHGDVGALHWRRLAPLLRLRGTALPPRHLVRPLVDVASERQRLSAFLRDYDLSADERRRWRV